MDTYIILTWFRQELRGVRTGWAIVNRLVPGRLPTSNTLLPELGLLLCAWGTPKGEYWWNRGFFCDHRACVSIRAWTSTVKWPWVKSDLVENRINPNRYMKAYTSCCCDDKAFFTNLVYGCTYVYLFVQVKNIFCFRVQHWVLLMLCYICCLFLFVKFMLVMFTEVLMPDATNRLFYLFYEILKMNNVV